MHHAEKLSGPLSAGRHAGHLLVLHEIVGEQVDAAVDIAGVDELKDAPH